MHCTGQISFMNEFSLYKDTSKLFFINNLYKMYRPKKKKKRELACT